MPALAVLIVVGAIDGPAARADGPDPGISYVLGACSRVVHSPCATCDERITEPLSGSFVLADGPLRTDLPNYLVRNLVLRSELVEAGGVGLLILTGGSASLLGHVAIGGREMFVSGTGSVTARFPQALHLSHVAGDGLTFDIYANPAALPDADSDGVADGDDLCSDTPCGAVVDRGGCTVDQLCPCAMRRDGEAWRSHADYVRCVIGATRTLRAAGKLDSSARLDLIKSAAHSACGGSVVAGLGQLLARR